MRESDRSHALFRRPVHHAVFRRKVVADGDRIPDTVLDGVAVIVCAGYIASVAVGKTDGKRPSRSDGAGNAVRVVPRLQHHLRAKMLRHGVTSASRTGRRRRIDVLWIQLRTSIAALLSQR